MTLRTVRPANTAVAIQRCGYALFRDRRTGIESFTRRLGEGFYPRFHIYAEEQGDSLRIDIHLDQKRPSYGVGHAHSGEYDGPAVDAEVRRISKILKGKSPFGELSG